jgi:hypothetical protein
MPNPEAILPKHTRILFSQDIPNLVEPPMRQPGQLEGPPCRSLENIAGFSGSDITSRFIHILYGRNGYV